MTGYNPNEGKCCDAIIRHIEARAGSIRQDLQLPERQGHSAPVELTCTLGDRLFAFEHTRIEPFEGHIRLQAEAPRHFRPVMERLAGVLPQTEDFELMIPAGATAGLHDRDLLRIQTALVNWISEIAPTLPIAPLGRYLTPIQKVTLPEVPFEVSLHRHGKLGRAGRFSISHLVDGGNKEAARQQRIQRACEKKFGKLAAWKNSKGARTVLVLEDIDIQLTNAEDVAKAVLAAECVDSNKPDEIYLVTTCCDPWWCWCIRIVDRTFFDFDDPDERAWEVAPTALVDLMKG
ncbi:MAG: hypothetical protein ACREC0_03835 [Methylocella sp.]